MIEQSPRPIPPNFIIAKGEHSSFEDGACALELVAWMAGEKHGDHPECTCPVIGAFVRSWNDSLDDEARNRILIPLLPRLIGTRIDKDAEAERAWMATDWLIRVCAPAFLRITPSLRGHAEILSGLSPVESRETVESAQGKLNAARDAAWDAARDAARDAAGDAARDAAWDAARAAARATVRAAARAAAWDAAWDAARDAARAAAWDAAGDAVRAAAGAADGAADGAAAAAMDALQPTVVELQTSAVLLLERMIEVGA